MKISIAPPAAPPPPVALCLEMTYEEALRFFDQISKTSGNETYALYCKLGEHLRTGPFA